MCHGRDPACGFGLPRALNIAFVGRKVCRLQNRYGALRNSAGTGAGAAYTPANNKDRRMNRLRHRYSTWIAILAMTLNALWPMLAQAKPGSAPTLHEVCTASGMQIVSVQGDLPADQQSSAKASPHCAFCSLGTDLLAIPPADQSCIARITLIRDAVSATQHSPVPQSDSRSPALPRAPPFLS